LQSLPKPNNDAVQLREVGEGLFAAIRFLWFHDRVSDCHCAANSSEQCDSVKGLELLPVKSQIARYNDPFTLPFNRRNEILIPVKQP
jgi:hypothetical protein